VAQQNQTVIYLPLDEDATDRWQMVAAALLVAGFTDLRPAPMPAQAYVPRQLRPVLTSNAGA
jgi:hypothetical protein